jgi:hypothetical protein
LATVSLALLAATCSLAGAAVSGGVSGLRGKVMKGPTKPVCRVDESCEAPAAGVVLQFRRSGTLVARATTTQTGTYSVRLRPGLYAVKAAQTRLAKTLTPQTVRVLRGRVARVEFHLDTGIQ